MTAEARDHRIFISYSSADKTAADQVCIFLEKAGIGCWIAPRDIPPGTDYPAAIIEGLTQCRAVVVLISPTALESPHILSELGHAFSRKIPIVPFRLSAVTLNPDFDYFLSLTQWLDASDGCTPNNLSRLKEAWSKAQFAHISQAESKSPTSLKRILLSTAVLAAALAALVWWKWPSTKSVNPQAPPITAKVAPPNDAAEKTAPGPQSWVNPKDGLTYVRIPPGQFVMGCSAGDTACRPDESPSHPVDIPDAFWIGQTEVTNAAYQRIVPSAKSAPAEAKLPVVGVSWKEARSFCAAVNGRLPTEAEWEYAARAGNVTAYYDVLSKIAWYEADSEGARHEVATKKPNAFGLYDTLGNASEWVADRYYNQYDLEAPPTGKVQLPLAGNASALTRGGFWESPASAVRVSHRIPMDNQEPAPMAGIRCVLDRK
jgi:formylglycine-generating enzyme required for sulfatase activity